MLKPAPSFKIIISCVCQDMKHMGSLESTEVVYEFLQAQARVANLAS